VVDDWPFVAAKERTAAHRLR